MKVDDIIRVSLKVLPGRDLQTVIASPKTTTIKLVDLLKKTLYGPTEAPISSVKLDDLAFIAETTPSELFRKPILVMIKQKRDDLLNAGTVVVVDGAHRLIAMNRVLMRRESSLQDLSINVTTYAIPRFYFEEMVTLPRLLLDPLGTFQVPEVVFSWAYAVSVHNCKYSAPEGANDLATVRSACEVASKWMVGAKPEDVSHRWAQQAIAHDLVALTFIRLVSTKFIAMYSFAPKQFQQTLQEIHSKGKLPKTPMCDYLVRIMKNDPDSAADVLKDINEQDIPYHVLYNRLRDLLPTNPNEGVPVKRRKVKSNLSSIKYGGKKRSLGSTGVIGEPPRTVREGNVFDVPSILHNSKEEDEEWKPLIMDELADNKTELDMDDMDEHNQSLSDCETSSAQAGPSLLTSGLAGMIQNNGADRHNLSLPVTSSSKSNSSISFSSQMTLRPPQPVERSHVRAANTFKKKTKLAALQTKDRWNYLLRGIPEMQKYEIVNEMEKMGVQFFPKTPCRNRYSFAWHTELKNEIKAKCIARGTPDPFENESPSKRTVESIKVKAGPGRPKKIQFPYSDYLTDFPGSSGVSNLTQTPASWAARNIKLAEANGCTNFAPQPSLAVQKPQPPGRITFVTRPTVTVVPRKVQPLPASSYVIKQAIPVVNDQSEGLFATVKEEANGDIGNPVINGITCPMDNGSALFNGVLGAETIKEEDAT